ncbi:MAG: cytochrome o ubiquinol oxidase subunit IV [Cytophaga sp.]|nr:cytochrome o ubiquinol oxidase subunit IV [Undibacterium sp.]
MSTHTIISPEPPASAHGQDDHHDESQLHADHGSLKSYMTGFVLAVILTAIPFALVMGKFFEKSSTAALVLLAFAAVQIVVHMIYFLHMNTRSEGGWTMLALIFTVMLLVIMLSGSIWVMYHLDKNMMPGMMPETMSGAMSDALPGTTQGKISPALSGQAPAQIPGAMPGAMRNDMP